MEPARELILWAGVMFGLASLILWSRGLAVLTPFHLLSLFFSIECLLAVWPQIPEDPHGRTRYWEFAPEVGWALIIVAVVTLAMSTLIALYFRRWTTTVVPRVTFPVRLTWVFAAAFGVSVVSSSLSVIRLGNFPLLVLSAAAPEEQIGYEQVFHGLVTFMGWGATRLMFILMGLLMFIDRRPAMDFVRVHRWLLVFLFGGMALNLLDGMRHLLVYHILMLVYALSLRGALTQRIVLFTGFALLAAFVALGTVRIAQVGQDRLIQSTGSETGDYILGWFVAYLEPNIYNLNNLFLYPPEHSNGVLLLSQAIPDRLLGMFVHIPESTPIYMANAQLFSQPGLTYRTIMADFIPDFGLWGAVGLTVLLLITGTTMLAMAPRRPRCLLLYLLLSLGLTSAPFMNLLVGVQVVIPLLALVLIVPSGRHADANALPVRTDSRGGAEIRA